MRALQAVIAFYQRFVSPSLPRRCRYEPTCSAYASRALSEYGILRGSALAAWRLVRCNPWSHGGFDPVHSQTLFARRPSLR
jgi:putative membrane protein insertion efficiency factor